MANLSSIYEYVQAEVPTCTSVLGAQKILEAARIFCNTSLAWQEELTKMDIVADQRDYDITPFVSSCGARELVRVIEVRTRGADVADTDDGIVLEEDISYHMFDKTTFRFNNIPTESIVDGLVLVVALKPSLTATTWGDAMDADWRETVAKGAKSLLMQMPSKTFTNYALSMEYRQQFYNDIRNAHSEWSKNYTYRKSRKPGFFGSTSKNAFVV